MKIIIVYVSGGRGGRGGGGSGGGRDDFGYSDRGRFSEGRGGFHGGDRGGFRGGFRGTSRGASDDWSDRDGYGSNRFRGSGGTSRPRRDSGGQIAPDLREPSPGKLNNHFKHNHKWKSGFQTT